MTAAEDKTLEDRIRASLHGALQEVPPYWLTRFVFLRLLGFVYLVAFLSLADQVLPLIGEHGLLPASHYLDAVEASFESKTQAFIVLPTLFWLHLSDPFLVGLAWTGVLLSSVVLIGFANGPLLFVLWFLYLSFVHIGQVWYRYGWEIQLLETGFLSIFLCPLRDMRPFPGTAPPMPVIRLLRWLAFRIYLGAGLIKWRGDPCWRNLTCLYHHYETQPLPNPLSRYAHFMPKGFHKSGVLWNHFIELIAPAGVFSPRKARYVTGMLLVSFQGLLILSGNLSFLNYLTILPALACFDDRFFKKILPGWITRRAERAAARARPAPYATAIGWGLTAVVAWLSIPVVLNMVSSRQVMNTSFNRLHLVNTYGAFGSVGKERRELIIEGTQDADVTPRTRWKAYEFNAKPGDPFRRLPVVAPYHYRVDWQIWFAAMETPRQNPWLLHLLWKLLANDPGALDLLANNPFPDEPPRRVRVRLYRYRFARPGAPDGAVWKRTWLGEWLPPLSRSDAAFQAYIAAHGWTD